MERTKTTVKETGPSIGANGQIDEPPPRERRAGFVVRDRSSGLTVEVDDVALVAALLRRMR